MKHFLISIRFRAGISAYWWSAIRRFINKCGMLYFERAIWYHRLAPFEEIVLPARRRLIRPILILGVWHFFIRPSIIISCHLFIIEVARPLQNFRQVNRLILQYLIIASTSMSEHQQLYLCSFKAILLVNRFTQYHILMGWKCWNSLLLWYAVIIGLRMAIMTLHHRLFDMKRPSNNIDVKRLLASTLIWLHLLTHHIYGASHRGSVSPASSEHGCQYSLRWRCFWGFQHD